MIIDRSQPTFGFASTEVRPSVMLAAHQHDDIELNLSEGDLEYRFGGDSVQIARNRLAIFWASRPHQLISSGGDQRLNWLTVPLRMFLSWEPPTILAEALLQGRVVVSDTEESTASLLQFFRRWQRDLAGTSAYDRATSALEINALMRRIGQRMPAADEARPGPPVDREAERAGTMARYISEHSSLNVGVADVAAAVHLHPNYAMALFRKAMGTTIGAYLAECRIDNARRLLISSSEPISSIGLTCGFGSGTQFYDRFRSASGTSPAAYRRSHRHLLGEAGQTITPPQAEPSAPAERQEVAGPHLPR